MDTFYDAKIIYGNNVERGIIGTIKYKRTNRAIDIYPKVLQCLSNAGHPLDTTRGRLYIEAQNEKNEFDEKIFLDFENISIIYYEVIKPDNEVTCAEFDGIKFYFQTSENCHLYYPHIHVSHSGDKISISLRNFRVKGKFKNPNKMKIATKYVKDNVEKLLEEWEKLKAN